MKMNLGASSEIKESLSEDCKALLSLDVLTANSFQEMYGTDLDSILDSDLFVDTLYTSFDDKDLRLLFLNVYLKKIKDNWEYIVFSEFLDKWENGNRCQKYVNDAKIALALELPDVIQGNKILRESV